MRFSVECAFSHLRKRGVASRKGALCARALTEKRILGRTNDAVRDAAVQGDAVRDAAVQGDAVRDVAVQGDAARDATSN